MNTKVFHLSRKPFANSFLSAGLPKVYHYYRKPLFYTVMEIAVSASMASSSGFLAGEKVHWRRERSM